MITLHHCPQTRSMRVLWLLQELGAEFTIVQHPFDKSLRSPAFLAKSPAGRVPALEINGEAMFESGAMIEYLCEEFPDAALGRLAGDPERREWLSWVHFSETISQHCAALTQQHIMLYEDSMRSPVLMKLEAKRLAKCYEAIEANLANDAREYMLKSGFSAADISVGQAVYMGRHFAHISPFPYLSKWYQRLTDRVGFHVATSDVFPGEGLYTRDFYEPWDV